METLVERLAAEKKAALDITRKGMENISDDEQKALKAHYEEAKKIAERIELFKSVDTDLDKLGEQPMQQGPGAKSLGELYFSELSEKGLSVIQTKSVPFQTSEFKAASDTHVVGGPDDGYGPLITDIDRNGVWGYERPLTIADLFASGGVAGNSIEYPVYGALEGSADSVAEGGQKPQVHLPEPTWKVDTLGEVAAWWKVSDNMADDQPYIVSEINQHAQYNLKLQEEIGLLSGDGIGSHLHGVLNRGIQKLAKGADLDQDRIFHATTLIGTATGFPTDAVVINPLDYEALRLSKDNNGQYYGGGFFNGQYGQGGIMQNPALWGLRTVVTASIAQGSVLVGAFKAGGMVFRKGGLRAESTNSNENDFTNDKITFRVKERLGLQVKYPAAFANVTLGAKAGA
ncbi:MAG: phage major capsid protein [Bifidobacterium sp.]|jgi:HK97 family phage major capsid protein